MRQDPYMRDSWAKTGTLRCLVLFLIGLSLWGSSSSGADYTVQWMYESADRLYGSPLVVDLNQDRKLEILLAETAAGQMSCLDRRGALLWSHTVSTLYAAPCCVDLDDDGALEVIFADITGLVTCLDHTGALEWERSLDSGVEWHPLVAADLDGDGPFEILAMTQGGSLVCLDAHGRSLWQFNVPGEGGTSIATAQVPDANRRDLILCDGLGAVTRIDWRGKIVWQTELAASPGVSLVVGDLNQDEREEAVVALGNGDLVLLDALNGHVQWRVEDLDIQDQTLSVGDLRGDGQSEILCGTAVGDLVALSSQGERLWTANCRGPSRDSGVCIDTPASLGDVDGDGEVESLVGGRSWRVHVVSPNGDIEWFYEAGNAVLGTPVLSDIDQDGQTEILVASKDRRLVCLKPAQVPGGTGKSRLPWPHFRHDIAQSANLSTLPPAVREAQPSEEGTVALGLKMPESLRMGQNELSLFLSSTARIEKALVASVEILEPVRLSLRREILLKPGGSETVNFPFFLRDLGCYSIKASIRETNAPWPLCVKEVSFELKAFAAENQELQGISRVLKHFRRITSGTPSGTPDRVIETLDRIEEVLRSGEEDYEDLDATDKDSRIAQRQEILRDAREVSRKAELAEQVLHRGQWPLFGLSAIHTLTKVFPDISFEGDLCEEASVQTAKNEREGVQVLVIPFFEDLKDLTVEVGDLKGPQGAVIPSGEILVNPQGYLQPGLPDRKVPHLGLHPDPLLPSVPMTVPSTQSVQGFWVTVHAPKDIPGGLYQGPITAKASSVTGERTERTLTLTARVWDFALSDETTLKTSVWIHEAQIASFYKLTDLPWSIQKNYYDLHLSHRCSPIMSVSVPPKEEELKAIEYVMSHGQNCLFVHIPAWLEEDERPAYADQLRETRRILQERGWDAKILLYSIDEVSPEDYEKLRVMNRWVHEIIPEWPRLETQPVTPEIAGAVDVWCPQVSDLDPERWEERQALGERLWTYCVWTQPSVMIDYPAVDHRVLFWTTWKYQGEGFLYWSSTYWPLNLTDPQGRRWPEIPWNTYTLQPGHNGCGQLIYPGPEGTALSSVRLEILRDGIEDYEVLAMLKRLLDAGKVPPELQAEAEQLLRIGPEIAEGPRQYSLDPSGILEHRRRLNECLEKSLGRSVTP